MPNLKIVWVQNVVILSKIIFLPAKSHMHIFNMLITSVQSFKLIAWKLWEELITQTCNPILKPNLKPNLKIVQVQNVVILSKIIFLPAKKHMHIFNMLTISVQSFKLITWKLWEELITQTGYPILISNLKIVWVQNAVVLSKIIFLPAQKHMHIFNMLTTSVQSFKLITWKLWEELITQTCYPILKPNLKIV